ncbi:MAG: hypothetical protein H0T42_10005 [Deltaproteobacteria bacterium]|nr:hypothetical protein [Deltaproteobacteria bacterium]
MRILIALAVGGACAGTSAPGESPSVEPADKRPAGAADCSDAAVATFEELGDKSGTRLALDGVPRVGVVCTLLECTDGRACCNRCGGEYALIDEQRRQVNLSGLAGCSGMDCNTVCDPFGRKPTLRYRFVGTYDHEQRRLAVEKFCAAN